MIKLTIEQKYSDDVRETPVFICNMWTIDFKIKVMKGDGDKVIDIKVKTKDAYITNYSDGVYVLSRKQRKKIAKAIKAKINGTGSLNYALDEEVIDDIVFDITNTTINCMILEDEDLRAFTSGKIGKLIPVQKDIVEELDMKGWSRTNTIFLPQVGKVIFLENRSASTDYGIPIIFNGGKLFVSERVLNFFKDELTPFVEEQPEE